MARITWIFTLLVFCGASLHTAAKGGSKVVICHNYGQITVAEQAVQAHLNHGDVIGDCPERPDNPDPAPDPTPDPGSMTAVVMMRCEAVDGDFVVVSLSASFDYASIGPVDPVSCPDTLSNLLESGFVLRSVTGGSAESDGRLHLYTDYLLLGDIADEGAD